MLAIGIDIVENKRIKKYSTKEFIEKILTIEELKIYNEKTGRKKDEFLCGRFAAKEAIIKSLSNFETPNMLEIEIKNNEKGAPIVHYKNYNLLLSISHEKNYTIAEAILIKKKN